MTDTIIYVSNTGHSVSRPINHIVSGCVQEKHQIWFKQGYCGSVVTDRVSLHYTRL